MGGDWRVLRVEVENDLERDFERPLFSRVVSKGSSETRLVSVPQIYSGTAAGKRDIIRVENDLITGSSLTSGAVR